MEFDILPMINITDPSGIDSFNLTVRHRVPIVLDRDLRFRTSLGADVADATAEEEEPGFLASITAQKHVDGAEFKVHSCDGTNFCVQGTKDFTLEMPITDVRLL